jgi:type I restriction enzyme M protein
VKLTLQQLEAHLWGAANILRGRTAGQDYKTYILSLLFFKRLCDQWEGETDDAIAELERQQGCSFIEQQKAVFRKRGEHRFKIPDGSRWGDVKAASTNIGEVLTKAMRAVADANDELRGVFTVDWNQPAPDGSGKPLIPSEVVHAVVQHFDQHNLSNKSVLPDVLGRAYEYLIKQFADDAGAKAGEFFTPSEVVDTLVRILEPRRGDTVYDPTSGSGGMLVHTADYLREHGQRATSARYFAQEMNWGNAAIGKINSVLHGLEADIKAGASTITDPQFLENGRVMQFSLILANFPFSDELWWLKPEHRADGMREKEKLKKAVFGKEGYKDPFGRFGHGTDFKAPPAGYGDYAFILHILASLSDDGRAGIVCPQGVLFRGQPEVDEETGELDDDGNPKTKRRKSDAEHLIRKALVDARVIDAVISLPPNVFYGTKVPACLLILRKQRPSQRRDQVLFIYAARHYRQLSARNELHPQDVMRILIHYHAYGDAARVPGLVAEHSGRIRKQIDVREEDEIGRLQAEYRAHADRLAKRTAATSAKRDATKVKGGKAVAQTVFAMQERPREKLAAKLAKRNERMAKARRCAEDDRQDVAKVADELVELYADPDELLKHARVVALGEIEENEFNLSVPRYIDTFEPEPRVEVEDALKALGEAGEAASKATLELASLLRKIGYGSTDAH